MLSYGGLGISCGNHNGEPSKQSVLYQCSSQLPELRFFYRKSLVGIAKTMIIFNIKLRPDIILSFSGVDKRGHR